MKYNKDNSLRQILEQPQMMEYLRIFYSEYLLGFFEEQWMDMPLCEVEKVAVSPWDDPFSTVVDQLLMAVELILQLREKGEKTAVSLRDASYGEWNPEQVGFGKARKEDVFLIAPRYPVKGSGKPAVIICPGGGYEEVCFSGEGTPVMKRMEAAGYVAFILRYRVAPAAYPAPQEDLDRAVSYVRSNAAQYGVEPDNVMVMGFSAGGHLCGSMPIYSQTPPDKLCLCYPVISLTDNAHEGSAENLSGGDNSIKEQWSLEKRVTDGYPKTFIWTLADDTCVPPDNTLRMMNAFLQAGICFEGHVYESGGHGCALAEGKAAAGWMDRMLEFMAE